MRSQGAIRAFYPLGITLLLACTPAGGSPPAPSLRVAPASPHRASSALRIDAAELATVPVPSLEGAIRRLRPEYLRGRELASPEVQRRVFPAVYLNDVLAGGADALGTIPLAAVVEVRFLTPAAARARFGSYCPCDGGVILVAARGG